MEKYRFSDEALAALEMLQVPLVVYQSLDKLTVAVAVSQGFRSRTARRSTSPTAPWPP